MPLSEFIPATRAKFDSNQSKMISPIPDLPSSPPAGDFLELLWENGHIVMQGQSSRPRKNSIPNFSPPLPTKLQEKEGREGVPARIGRFGAMDSFGNDLLATGVSGQIGPNTQDDDMVPWLNYPIDDYCLEFLTEFPGNSMNSPPSQVIPTDKCSNSSSQAIRDSSSIHHSASIKAFTGGPDPVRTRNSQFTQIPQQWSSSFSANKSRSPDFAATNNTNLCQNPPLDLPNTRLQGQDAASSPKLPPPLSSAVPGLVNFSHFSRSAALVKTTLQNVDRLKSNEKPSIGTSSYAVESTLIDSSCAPKSVCQGLLAPVTAKCEAKAKIPTQSQQELASVVHSEGVNWEDVSKDKAFASNKNQRPDHGSAFGKKVPDPAQEIEKCSEPVVASSSVCSGNGTGVASSDPKNRTKRKMQEGEESGYQSEDLDDESTGVRKPAASRGSTAKRSRAAEVHNLSERRRRDRINEKMRALQELIPNCNKVDKASMLDEAIEYLKTLQLQVQIMSMGSGMCMPPMMLPPGMQHLRPHPMAHFSPMSMGMGMGMGMGFGMGMLDMNGSPMIPVPPMCGTQFPCSSVPGNPGMPGVPMFGIPGQRHPVPMTHGSPYPLHVHSARMNFVPGVSGTTGTPINPVEVAPSGSLKDQQIEKNSETEFKVEAHNSHLPSCTQAAKKCLKESSTTQVKKTASHSSDGAINSSTGNGNSSNGTSCSVD